MRILVLLLVSIIPLVSSGQSRTKLEKERNAIIKKIEQTNKILLLTEKKSTNALKNLNLVDEEIKERKSLIDNFNDDISLSKKKVQNLEIAKDDMQTSLDKKLEAYRILLQIQLRKKILHRKWLYILSAGSLSESFLRYRYFEQYNSFFESELNRITESSAELKEQLTDIHTEQKTAEGLLQSQKINFDKLEKKKAQKKKLIDKLNKNKQTLSKTLKKAKKKRENLNKSIEKVILASLTKATESVNSKSTETGFLSKLTIPLDGAIVISKFGIQKHAEIGGVTVTNNGIDLESDSNNIVKAAYKGTAIAVIEAPNNGTMIILQHGSYYTVYANLVSVSIRKGDVIAQNKVIGHLGGARILHFELWRNKTKLDPMKWLK